MKKILNVMAPVLVLVLGYGVVQAMIAAKPEPEKKEETQRLVSLYVDRVREESVVLSVATQGEVQAQTEIDLVPQVSGQVVKLAEKFADGAGFEAGDTLFWIDDAEYQLAVTRAEARVAEANVSLMQQKAAADIKRRQWQSTGKTSQPSPLQVNRPQVIEAQAKLNSAEADLAESRLNLARTEIKAPFSGRVMKRDVGLGQFVARGTPLGRLFSTDKVEIQLPLTDTQLLELNLPVGFVANGDNGPRVKLRAQVGIHNFNWTGHIVRTLASVDRQTRLIYAIAEVDQPYEFGAGEAPLAVGMFVTAEIAGVAERRALVMPRTALRNADKVYVVNADDKLEIRTVEVISTSPELVLVSGGVAAGDRVVTSTIPSAVDGMLVAPITRVVQN